MASTSTSPTTKRSDAETRIPAEIVPLIAEAQRDMMKLEVADLDFLLSLHNPPAAITTTLQTVLTLLGVSEAESLTWEGVRREIRELSGNNTKMFHRILLALTFHTDSILSRKTWRKINSRFAEPDFHPILLKSVSLEASHLCEWLCAVSSYHKMETVVTREIGCKRLPDVRSLADIVDSPRKSPRNKSSRKSPRKSPRKGTIFRPEHPFPIPAELVLQEQRARDRLNAQDVIELRSYLRPPTIVKQVLYAVMLLFGVRRDGPRSWQQALDFMSGEDDRFLKKLIAVRVSRAKPARVQAFSRYIRRHEIDALWVGNASQAAAGLCDWAQKFSALGRAYCNRRQRRKASIIISSHSKKQV